MTNKELLNIYNALQEIKTTAFPAKISYTLVRSKNQMEPIMRAYTTAQREALVKYAEPVPEEFEQYYAPAQDSPYWKEIEDLDNMKVDIELPHFLLKDIENIDISLQVMNALMPMIEEED